MPKKQESMLGLAPLAKRSTFGESAPIVAVEAKRPSNRDEQWIQEEYQKQSLIMKGVEAKTVHAMKLIAAIHQEGVAVFDEATGQILATKDNQRDKEHQAFVDEFSTRGIQAMGRHLLGSMEVGATNIAVEVHRSLYPPVQPPPSLLQRIFG
jgi:hypothetical protein